MTTHQIELIVARAVTNGLSAFGAAELRRDLALATGTPEVLTGSDNGVWSVPVALPPILPPLRRRGETTLPPWQSRLRDPEPYGVIG